MLNLTVFVVLSVRYYYQSENLPRSFKLGVVGLIWALAFFSPRRKKKKKSTDGHKTLTVLWFHIRCGLFSPHNSIRNEKQPNDKSQFCDYSSCTKLIRQATWVAGGTQQTSIWSPVTFICPTVARSVSRCRQKNRVRGQLASRRRLLQIASSQVLHKGSKGMYIIWYCHLGLWLVRALHPDGCGPSRCSSYLAPNGCLISLDKLSSHWLSCLPFTVFVLYNPCNLNLVVNKFKNLNCICSYFPFHQID